MALKWRERSFVESFLRNVGWTASRIEESESPDFLIDLEDTLVGLEVTESPTLAMCRGNSARWEKT